MKITKKASLLILLVVVLAGIVMSCGFTGKEENPKNKKNVESPQKSTVKPKISEEEQKKAKEAEEKQKRLEDKYQKGYEAFHSQKNTEAIKLEDEVLMEDDTFYKAYNVKGIALCYSGKFNDGMANIDKALAIKPDYGYARFNKALANELYGRFDEALKWYDKSLEVENYIWTYYGIASIYGRRGDVPNTIKYLKIAVEMEPGIKGLAKEEADFNPVKKSKEFQELTK